MGKIEAIIFDWGGVLIDDPRPALMRYCANALSVLEEDYVEAHKKFAEQFQKGIISEEAFWVKVCAELGRPKPTYPSLWGEAFRSVYSPRQEVFALASELHRNGYKTAVLSNTEVPAMEFFYEQRYDMGAPQTRYKAFGDPVFDVLVFSCTEGTIKPERKIYKITLEKLISQPGQTVFIDDRPEFIEGAKQAGINTILFNNLEQIKKELVQLGMKMD